MKNDVVGGSVDVASYRAATAAIASQASSFEDLLGDFDGVSVHRVDGVSWESADSGFSVTFPMDRKLSQLISNVPGAEFNKEIKAFVVPAANADALAQAVAAMRRESLAVTDAGAEIMALAKATGLRMQVDFGAITEAKPQLSSFIVPGKSYFGEIVNANSHFVAQFSSFGKDDGAAFIQVHRLANLDSGQHQLMKGDKVAVVYDAKFAGVVSDMSQYKSAAELEADYEINLGQMVDGVAVSDRGDKIGVAFSMNPVMAARIRKVEGAAFNKEDRVWEVPKSMQKFALIAAQDLRSEFLLDAQEVAKLHLVAESKIDGAKVYPAFTKDGTGFSGPVIAVADRYALQKTGRDGFTLHHLSQLDAMPVEGLNMAVKYNKGVGAVFDRDQQQQQGQGVGR